MLTRPTRAPGWQLSLLFIGYPIWWMLGVAPFVMLFATASLALELSRRRPLRLPAGFSFWLLFLAWVGLGVLVVQSNAPLAVAELNINRYLTWALRLLFYLQATVILLYVVNARERATFDRVLNAFGWMFVWIVAGGLLGTLAPHVEFSSLMELVLPHQLTRSAYVLSLIHPNLVEHVLISGITRPSAPFPYANVWGLNFACFLPCFVRSWCGSQSHRRRAIALVLLAVSVVPVITSLNRGLWLALAMAMATVVVRLALERRTGLLIGTTAVAVVAVVLLAITPLSGLVSQRLDSPNSNKGRTELATRGFVSTLSSPIVGYGTTRDVQGSLTSIAGGATASCPRCSPPSFGTQGQLFLITFATGYVGGFFYLAFLILMLVRGFRIRGPDVTMACAILVMHLSTMAVYSADNLAILPIFLALGTIGRELQQRGVPARQPWVVSALRARPRIAVGAVALGAICGVAWHIVVPPPVTMTTSVVLPEGGQDGATDTTRFLPTTLDTLAEMVDGDTVADHVVAATGESGDAVSRNLDVSAVPNTRVINLLYTSSSRARATAGSEAAAAGLLAARQQQLKQQQDSEMSATDTAVDGFAASVLDLQRGLGAVNRHLRGPITHNIARQLAIEQVLVTNRWQNADKSRRQVLIDPPLQGELAGATRPVAQPVSWGEPTANGLAAGVLLATGIGLSTKSRRRRAPGSEQRTTEVIVKSSDRPYPPRGTMVQNSGEARVARLEPRGSTERDHAQALPHAGAGGTTSLAPLTAAFRRRWLSALITFLIVLLLSAAYVTARGGTYTSATSVFLQPLSGNALATASSSNPQALTVAMQTEASIASSHQVLDLASQSLGRKPGVVTAIVPQNTQIVRIEYTGTSPENARIGATAVADAFLAYRTSQAEASVSRQRETLQQQIKETKASLKSTLAQISAGSVSPQTTVDVQLLTTRLSGLTDSLSTLNALNTNAGSIVKTASAGRAPVLGRPVVVIFGGVLLGLVAAFVVVMVRERLDDRIHVGRSAAVAGLPVLSWISHHDAELSRFVDGLDTGHPLREAYRQARAGVIATTERPSIVTVTSFAGCGPVSYLGCNLALALSEAGYRVRIVDASLEGESRPDFPLNARPGLAGHLVSKQSRELKLARWHHIEMLPAGRNLGSLRDLFSSERMSALLERLSKVADYVILLAPEVTTSEAVALSGLSDATVMVGRDGLTTMTEIREQAVRHRSLGAEIVGLIVLDQKVETGAAPVPEPPTIASADDPI